MDHLGLRCFVHISMVPEPREKGHLGLVLTEGGQSDLLAGFSGHYVLSQPLALMCIYNTAAVLYPFLAISYTFVSTVTWNPVS